MSKFTLAKRKQCIDFIRNHHSAMTREELGKQLSVSSHTVKRIVRELGLNGCQPKKRNPRPALVHSSGIFNVDVHQNWLAGSRN